MKKMSLILRMLYPSLLIILLLPIQAFADKGMVVKEDVCGFGNAIIETTDGWYVAAEHYSGVYLYEGDVVFGKFKTYGFEEITRMDGRSGRFYIEDYESNIEDAFEELCD